MTQTLLEREKGPAITEEPVLGKRLGPALLARMKMSQRLADIPTEQIFYLGPYYAGGAANDQNHDRVREALKQIRQDRERAQRAGVLIDGYIYGVVGFAFRTKMSPNYEFSDDILVGILGGVKA